MAITLAAPCVDRAEAPLSADVRERREHHPLDWLGVVDRVAFSSCWRSPAGGTGVSLPSSTPSRASRTVDRDARLECDVGVTAE